jgi:hypothetical protein
MRRSASSTSANRTGQTLGASWALVTRWLAWRQASRWGRKQTGPDRDEDPGLEVGSAALQVRVTVYCPQAVYSIVTVPVRSPRTTTILMVPASILGLTSHSAL